MATIIGREHEKKILKNLLSSGKPEFAAVYGRRRVGKTYLIENFCKNKGLFFKVTGQYKSNKSIQIENFTNTIGNVFYDGLPISPPKSWSKAFDMLKEAIVKKKPKGALSSFWMKYHGYLHQDPVFLGPSIVFGTLGHLTKSRLNWSYVVLQLPG